MGLKELIQKKGLKQKWIAEQIGVSPQLLSMFLNNERNLSEEKIKMIKGLLS